MRSPSIPTVSGADRTTLLVWGLNLWLGGDRLRASFTPQEVHQGWPGTVHGGIITALLHEIMENLMYK